MATLPLKASRNEQCSVILFCGQKDLVQMPPTIQSRLGPSDYHLFGLMKKLLSRQSKFASDTEAQSTVRQWPR